MSPELRQLQALVCIARLGTLARAADALHCSPSALSLQLTELQRRLGCNLLRRTGRGLVLSAEGERLLPAAQAAVAAVERLVDEASQGGPSPRTASPDAPAPVSLGTVLDPDAIRLGELLRAVRARCPGVLPELRHGMSGWVQREVLSGALDLGFTLGEVSDRSLRSLRLATLRYVVVAPRGWQARLHGLGWSDLAALPWIATPPDSVHHRLLKPLLARLGRQPPVVAHVDQEASMIDLVRAGFGLSLAREAVALREADAAGLAVWRQQPLDTALSLISRVPPPDATRAATLDHLFDAAATIWR